MKRFFLLLGLFPCLGGIFHPISIQGREPISVFVSILPQKYFVQKIADGLVDVSVMVLPGANPHVYDPKPNQMVALSRAKIFFAIGVTFEDAWLEKIAAMNPKMQVVHTETGIQKIPMEDHPHEKENEGGKKHGNHNHDEDHGTMDPHIWIAPQEVKIIASNILKALKDVDPDHASIYESNYHAFIREIEVLDGELKQTFENRTGVRFMVFHPSWGYFARAYGLVQIPIEVAGKEPKPAQLAKLIGRAKEEEIKVIFVQPQFSSKSAKTIASAIGAQLVFADPLSQDWKENLRELAQKFKAALR